MGLDLDLEGAALQEPADPVVILLDTNALIWLEAGHPRARPLTGARERLYASPASVLELQFLLEAGRLRLHRGTLTDIVARGPWLVDDPPSAAWFETALEGGWTRDPFDRLIVAHAEVRGWRLATGDRALLSNLPERRRLEL